MLNIKRYQWWKNKITPHVRRIILSASVFILVSTSLAFHAPLYNSDVSVEFDVVNKDGKSYYQYPKDDTSEVKKFKKKYTFLAGVVGFTNAGRVSSFRSTDYTYTGNSTYIDDGRINNKACWRIKFLTSGTFIPKKQVKIDIFLVGGGAGGGDSNGYADGAGGGSGRTGTWLNITLIANTSYVVTIGAGSACYSAGGVTSFIGGTVNNSASGGNAIVTHYYGSSGGSGGASGSNTSSSSSYGAAGGSNGGNGGTGSTVGGSGQGTTTYEFGDTSLSIYAGGGGAGAWGGTGGAGGSGGGGAGASGYGQKGNDGTANTGGGGGGASRGKTTASGGNSGGLGGSGIGVIRNTRS